MKTPNELIASQQAEIAALQDQLDHMKEVARQNGRHVTKVDAEIAALRKAVTAAPVPEKMAQSMFEGIASAPQADQFNNFNWFTAGVTCAEEWQKLYLDAALAQAVQP